MITFTDLASLFGKTEMEIAAAKIVNMVLEAGSWGIRLDPTDFRDDDDELCGLVFLALYVWLDDAMEGTSLVIQHEFAEKVVLHLDSELPDLGTLHDFD
jgi:hypothetical protein